MGVGFRLPVRRAARYTAPRIFAAFALVAATIAAADPPAVPTQVPSGTRVRFHLTQPLSSDQSKTGQLFRFVLIDPIEVGDQIIAKAGAIGLGSVMLAGPAGQSGHEGDLTLRLDSVPTVDGGQIVFDNQRFEINGTNEKAVSAVAGFIPFVGIFSRFIRGAEIHLGVDRAIDTALLLPATILTPPPMCTPVTPPPAPAATIAAGASASPGASAAPTATPTASPTPVVSPTPCIPPPPCAPGTPTDSPSALLPASPAATLGASASPSASATPSPTPAPTATPCTVEPLCTPIPTATPTAAASVATAMPQSTATPAPAISPTPAATPTPIPCVTPTPEAYVTPYRPQASLPGPTAPPVVPSPKPT